MAKFVRINDKLTINLDRVTFIKGYTAEEMKGLDPTGVYFGDADSAPVDLGLGESELLNIFLRNEGMIAKLDREQIIAKFGQPKTQASQE